MLDLETEEIGLSVEIRPGSLIYKCNVKIYILVKNKRVQRLSRQSFCLQKSRNMAEVDDWAAESEPRAEEPVEVIPERTWVDIKLFGKWSTEDVQVPDMSLQDYIAVKEKFSKFVPHSAGR